jgi:5'-nucleotidase
MSQTINRRNFVKSIGGLGAIALLSPFPLSLISAKSDRYTKLTILSTNDVHSRIDPFPASDQRYAGMAGFAQRASLVNQIRTEVDHVLLFDAGDIFQGTPYFNMYGGELEFKLMSQMGYDAATMGNHDFDNGLEGFKKHLPLASFPFICSNYGFENTCLNQSTITYKIFQKGDVKIGVIGMGIQMEGLISKKNYGNTIYHDPIQTANELAKMLKAQSCDFIVCLSHLGFEYSDEGENRKISDKILAQKTRHIDYIIGGHTHTFMDKAVTLSNLDGKAVIISQSGWGGIMLGRLDLVFSKDKAEGYAFIYTTKKVVSQV